VPSPAAPAYLPVPEMTDHFRSSPLLMNESIEHHLLYQRLRRRPPLLLECTSKRTFIDQNSLALSYARFFWQLDRAQSRQQKAHTGGIPTAFDEVLCLILFLYKNLRISIGVRG